MASRRPTLLSTFTGAGGLDLGLERAGFEVLGCIEIDAIARETLGANRPAWRILEPHNITELASELRPRDLGLRPGQLALLAGGPPCQPYSKAAQWSPNGRSGTRDPRADGLHGFTTLINTFLPRALLIENVPGFARGRESAVPLLEDALTKINARHGTQYRLQRRVLLAAEYGVPQRRERAILVAIRDGASFRWPVRSSGDDPVRAWDAIGHLSPNGAPHATGKWAELLPSIPEGQNYLWHTSRGGGRSLFGYRTRYWSFLLKLAKDQPAWTLPGQPGPATGPFHWHNRPLSIKEMLRLQSFPATWKVAGEYREQVLQVGNATPPLLAEVLGRTLGEQLFGLSYQGRPTLYIRRKRRVAKPERRRAVPGKYLLFERLHPDHPGTGKGPRPRTKTAG